MSVLNSVWTLLLITSAILSFKIWEILQRIEDGKVPKTRLCHKLGFCNIRVKRKAVTLPRNSYDSLRKSGSIFGFLKMKLNCPAAPAYEPKMFWEPVQDSRGGPSETPVRETAESIFLLIGILSGCRFESSRNVIRETWLESSQTDGRPDDWRAVFVVGRKCQTLLREEQEAHGDLLFVDSEDSYFSLTSKVLRFFDYANALKAQYAMKTDDDSYVAVGRVMHELRSLPRSCLYWGQANRLPDLHMYRLSALSVPLHKWYIPRADFASTLEQTVYMQGGGYVLSRDLIARVAQRREEPPAYLPEDAVLGHVLGRETVSQCMCSDLRMVKEAYNFQSVNLFGNTTMPCEVSDVAHRVLNVHAIHEAEDMRWFHRLVTSPLIECSQAGRNFSGYEFQQIWGYSNLNAKPQRPMREAINLWKKLQASKPRVYNGRELVPALFLIGDNETNRLLPWCTRMQWAQQVLQKLSELARRRELLCNVMSSSFFVNATSLDIHLDPGEVQLTYGNATRLMAGNWCFANEVCHGCFLSASRSFLDDGRCSKRTRTCVGYDGVSQGKVFARKFLRLLFSEARFPASPKRKFLFQVNSILDGFLVRRSARDPRPQDWIVHRALSDFEALRESYEPRATSCLRLSRERVLGAVARFLQPPANGSAAVPVMPAAGGPRGL